ncbi:MAG: serine acetyltransferase [Erysipelothrix sp.]|nr:serine acetyltransferase [Erysipelothrix sp.]
MKWLDTAKAYKEKDPSIKSLLEVILLNQGYHALGYYRVAHFFYSIHLYFIAKLISQLGRFFTLIEIHPGAQIGRRLVIDHGAGVVIGETAIIKDDVLIYHGVTLGGLKNTKDVRHPTIGNRVLIGAHASVLGNIEVKDDAKIGAHALVLKDVGKGQVIYGIPSNNNKELFK